MDCSTLLYLIKVLKMAAELCKRVLVYSSFNSSGIMNQDMSICPQNSTNRLYIIKVDIVSNGNKPFYIS